MQRLVIRGKRRDLVLGSWPLVSLREAREAALENRLLARAGRDSVALKRHPEVPTFEGVAGRVIALREPTWKDGVRSAEIWRSSLARYAVPRLGGLRVSEIDKSDVMAVLLPIWTVKYEAVRHVRNRIGAVMKWSMAQSGRCGCIAGGCGNRRGYRQLLRLTGVPGSLPRLG